MVREDTSGLPFPVALAPIFAAFSQNKSWLMFLYIWNLKWISIFGYSTSYNDIREQIKRMFQM
jgi:hypothetical protein